MIEAVQRFRVDDSSLQGAGAVEQWLQRLTPQISRNGRLREVEDRRHEIHVLHDVLYPPASTFAGRLLDDERHAHGFLVHEQPVLLLAVIAEPFAVIRDEDDG